MQFFEKFVEAAIIIPIPIFTPTRIYYRFLFSTAVLLFVILLQSFQVDTAVTRATFYALRDLRSCNSSQGTAYPISSTSCALTAATADTSHAVT